MSKVSWRQSYEANTKELLGRLGLGNRFELPKISKVTVNVGLGRLRQSKETLALAEECLRKITGQKPVKTHAKKSIAGFKLRAGEVIGFKVTLRGRMMDDFLERLVNIYLPRVRDFRGLTLKNFDKQGNLSIGFNDLTAFSEVGHVALENPFGLEVTVTIKNSTPERSVELLGVLGFPMRRALGVAEQSG